MKDKEEVDDTADRLLSVAMAELLQLGLELTV
jgi:hypothetical protein